MNHISRRRPSLASLPLVSLALATLVLGACGGSDSDSGSADRDKLVDQLIEVAGNDGATIDRDCARKVADQLSDADVEAILAAGPDGDAETSAEADEIGAQLIECVKDFGTALDGSLPDTDISVPAGIEVTDALIEQIASSIEAAGAGTVDRTCLKDALAGLDMSEVATQAADPEFMQQYISCITPAGG